MQCNNPSTYSATVPLLYILLYKVVTFTSNGVFYTNTCLFLYEGFANHVLYTDNKNPSRGYGMCTVTLRSRFCLRSFLLFISEATEYIFWICCNWNEMLSDEDWIWLSWEWIPSSTSFDLEPVSYSHSKATAVAYSSYSRLLLLDVAAHRRTVQHGASSRPRINKSCS